MSLSVRNDMQYHCSIDFSLASSKLPMRQNCQIQLPISTCLSLCTRSFNLTSTEYGSDSSSNSSSGFYFLCLKDLDMTDLDGVGRMSGLISGGKKLNIYISVNPALLGVDLTPILLKPFWICIFRFSAMVSG